MQVAVLLEAMRSWTGSGTATREFRRGSATTELSNAELTLDDKHPHDPCNANIKKQKLQPQQIPTEKPM